MHGGRGESKFTPTRCPCAIQVHCRCIQALVPHWAAMYLHTLHWYRCTSLHTSIHISLHTSLHPFLYPCTHLYPHLSSPQPSRNFTPIGERGVRDGELKGLWEAASRRHGFTLPHRVISPSPPSNIVLSSDGTTGTTLKPPRPSRLTSHPPLNPSLPGAASDTLRSRCLCPSLRPPDRT